jgi:hypothetical protein
MEKQEVAGAGAGSGTEAGSGNVVVEEAGGTDRMEQKRMGQKYETGEEEEEEEEEYTSELPSFLMNEEEANERENAIDPATLSVDESFNDDLTELKQNLYNTIIYGPPVGSEEAQDLQNLEQYEGLLVQLCNLATQVLRTGQPQQMPLDLLQQYPTNSQPLVVAYYEHLCDFQRTNTDPQLKDVLEDFLQRRLKEQPSPY